MTIDNSTPWQMLRNQLESYISGQSSDVKLDGLQIVTTPLQATWDNKEYGMWDAWEHWANTLPLWGEVYVPSVGNRATDAYFQILTNIDVPNASDSKAAAEAKQIASEMSQLQLTIGKKETEMFASWKEFNSQQTDVPPAYQKTFGTWYAENYGATISPLRSELANLIARFASASNKAGGGYQLVGKAITDFSNEAYQARQKTDGGTESQFRTWSLQPNLRDWIKEAKHGKCTELSLVISTSTKTESKSSLSAGGSVGFSWGIFSLKAASGGYSRETVNTSEKNFKMQWKAKSFTAIRISAGPWYSQNVLQTFKQGPWLKDGSFGNGRATPFGKNGTYSLQPAVIYVAYQPAVSATVDKRSYDFLKQGWEAGLEIGIGPFSFGGKASGSNSTATWNDDSLSFTMTSTSEHAQVVAVLNNVMPGN